MSSSDGSGALARIELRSRIASVELSVIAADFRPLAVGMGRLEVEVPPGIYQVVARAGPIVDRRLVNLEPGATYSDGDMFVAFPAPAPVSGTTTSHEYHQEACIQASADVADAAGPPSGLVVVVRDVRGTDGPLLEPVDLGAFDLLDQSLNRLAGWETNWRLQHDRAIATWSGRLLAGGYVLRTDPSHPSSADRNATGGQRYDLSLWLSPGWQTIVFVTTGPGGPLSASASVHMAPIDLAWSPFEAPVGLALELATWGLREGRSAVPDDLLGVLLNTKFVNPMLGIVGAHSLFLRAQPDPTLLRTVVDNLQAMVGGHPDVVALRGMLAARAAEADGAPLHAAAVPADGGVAWPPMLLPSYRALIEIDALDPGVIEDGSPAERAASNLLVQGIWTTWAPIPPGAPAVGSPAGRLALPSAVGVLPLLGREPERMDRLSLDDPATARVAGYLTALAALEGPDRREERFATLSPQEIGLATTLPAGTVDRTLARIAAATAAPPGQRTGGEREVGPDGPLSGVLPLFVVAALVVAGILGVSWCAGNEDCALAGGGATPSPTDEETVRETPREQPTAAPATDAPATDAPATDAPATDAPATDAPATDTPPTDTPQPVELSHDSELPRWRLMLGATESREFPVTASAPLPGPVRFVIEEGAGAFSVAPECDPVETEPGSYGCTALITFAPLSEGPFEATMTVSADGAQTAGTVNLGGDGLPLVLQHPDSIVFPDHYLGEPPRTVSFALVSVTPVQLLFRVVDDQAGFFSADESCDWAAIRGERYRCRIETQFEATDNGDYSAMLEIVTPEPSPRRIRMVGRALNPPD